MYVQCRWWKSAQVVNSHLVCDSTIRQPGFDLPRQQWSLLNRFRTEQRHCGACKRKWRLTDTDLCPCGETQTMSHIVKSCPLTKLNGGLSRLHSADEDAVSLLTNYYAPAPVGEAWALGGHRRLSSVCLSDVAYIGSNSKTNRPRKTKLCTGVPQVTCDSHTEFKVKSQGGAGA